jgi:hypothetical protein
MLATRMPARTVVRGCGIRIRYRTFGEFLAGLAAIHNAFADVAGAWQMTAGFFFVRHNDSLFSE